MNRRALLQGSALALGLTATGCQLQKQLDPRNSDAPPPTGGLPHGTLLDRAAFGPSLASQKSLAELGESAWLAEQLNAPLADTQETPGLQWQLRGIDLFDEEGYELRDRPPDEVLSDLQRAELLRAIYSKWQLRERMCEFWGNHFNIYARKVYTAPHRDFATGELAFFLGEDIAKVSRKEALGSFPKMVRESMRSTAMMGYLDNQVSKKDAPNENYARELLELHTLGVDGGYTQNDVREVARCLTGWTIHDEFLKPTGTVYFNRDLHDDGEKRVLGTRIPAGGGEKDADRVWELVTTHPATARFIARKLVRHFYGEGNEDKALQAKVATRYGETRGDIKELLKTLFNAKEYKNAPPLVKRPLDYVVSALREANARTEGGAALHRHLAAMGQGLYEWPMPDGYPDRTAAWTGSLLARWNFAIALAFDQIDGTRIEHTDSRDDLALRIASPAFQWR